MHKYFFYFIFILLIFLAGLNFYSKFLVKPTPSRIENLEEEFDANLYKLNTLSNVIQFVDNQYGSNKIDVDDSLVYANLIARTLRMRFYHGWSQYGFKDNWVLYLLSPIHEHSLGIVDPNDMLKYPEALCSQQAMVGMMALRSRGFTFRKVGFYDPKYGNGHFTYEIKLKDGWHFYDIDMELNLHVIESNNRPSIDSLAKNAKMRRAAYSSETTKIKDELIPKYNNNHPLNVFPAKNMLAFHRVTLFLSFTLWFWVGLFFGLHRLIRK